MPSQSMIGLRHCPGYVRMTRTLDARLARRFSSSRWPVRQRGGYAVQTDPLNVSDSESRGVSAGGREQHFAWGARIAHRDDRDTGTTQRLRKGVVRHAWRGIGQQRQILDQDGVTVVKVDDLQPSLFTAITPA